MERSLLLLLAGTIGAQDPAEKPYGGVLETTVAYSPLPPSPHYTSNATFDPRGMEHVYLIANTFLDLIQREDVLPPGLNLTTVLANLSSSGEPVPGQALLATHWQQLLLQHIGTLTATVFGLLLAGILPIVGFFFCCCRCCCGRCGVRPESPYDKRGDGCRRVFLGLLLSLFVIAALFGSVCSFVTNYYSYTGAGELSGRMGSSLQDARLYLDHTDRGIDHLLVKNFGEMESEVVSVVERAGPLVTARLANLTGATAAGRLADLANRLPGVRSALKDLSGDTRALEDQVRQLGSGLLKARESLGTVLGSCSGHRDCQAFTRDYRLAEDLTILRPFLGLSFTSANHGLANAAGELTDLLAGGLVAEVAKGQEGLDLLEKDLTRDAAAVAPKVKAWLAEQGAELGRASGEVSDTLSRLGQEIPPLQEDLPILDSHLRYVEWRYYLGLATAGAGLLVLTCFILGLFYGLCGKRPGGLYGDDCCNRGTGAAFLAAGAHLTFLLGLPVLLLTTAHFLMGSALHQAACRPLRHPAGSDLFLELDTMVLTPRLRDLRGGGRGGALAVLTACHANATLYTALGLEGRLEGWSSWQAARAELGRGLAAAGARAGQRLATIQLLGGPAATGLAQLAASPLTKLELTQFAALEEGEVTAVDLQRMIRRLRTLKEQLGRQEANRGVANNIELEVRWLEQMATVAEELRLTVRRLQARLARLDAALGGQASLRAELPALVAEAAEAERTLRDTGPALVAGLAGQLGAEVAGLVSGYMERVEAGLTREVGACAPLSEAFNATVSGLCDGVVQPLNGFWASVGWCFLLYLPSVMLAVSLIQLYRKTESYPGPHAEAEVQPLDGRPGEGKGRGRGHRRQASHRLPEFTHSRALPALPPDEDGQAPPQYSSTPSLPAAEYERPPPYYLPGRAK